jgi:uncharacterized protein
MGSLHSLARPTITRRRFLQGASIAAAGLAVYSGEVARHDLQVTRRDARIPGLPSAFDGLAVAQLSDIHLDEFTEPFFLREAVARVNSLNPDLVFLTGDYITHEVGTLQFAIGAAWQCANILQGLKCRRIYAVLGNHDIMVNAKEVTAALTDNGIPVLRNSYLPLERNGSRIWLAGLDDPLCGRPRPDLAIPPSIRHVSGEPVILLCHAPDYAHRLVVHPAGQAVSLMLSGHTHGGQVRMPLVGAIVLPVGGKLYPEGEFQLGHMSLYVNRGLGTVGVPFRFDCPPEITLHTLRTA